MANPIIINGTPITLAWNQESAKRYEFRASTIGGGPMVADFRKPAKSTAAITTFIWLLLPQLIHAKYPTPEDLFLDLDHENQSESITDSVLAVFEEMNPTPEKKSTSRKSPSRGSNSA